MTFLLENNVTTSILWQAALAFALIDVVLVALLVKQLTSETLRQLKPFLLTTTALFWFVVWILMSLYFWEPVYHYVFPPWSRWLIPPVYAILFALAALLFWWLSFHLPFPPTFNFCVLGGLWGMVSHLWGISRGLIDKPPILRGLNALAVAIMPIFEFIFYWCVILTISFFVYRHSKRPRSTHMISTVLILTLGGFLSAPAQSLGRSEYEHYSGYYTVANRDSVFTNFEQFELHVHKKKGYPPRLESKVRFFTDTLLTDTDTECVTNFRRFFISRDSLFFQTQICFGESYEFAGHFLGVPSGSEVNGNNPILEGTMVFQKNHKVVRRAAVGFLWDEGD